MQVKRIELHWTISYIITKKYKQFYIKDAILGDIWMQK